MLANILLLVAVVCVAALLSSQRVPNSKRTKERYSSCLIDSNHACNSLTGAPLHPVNEPSYNLKQVIIQMLLLEDHLFHKEKQCASCIKKHILMIEGLADEGITLDIGNIYTYNFEAVLKAMNELEGIYKSDPALGAQRVRDLRRELIERV
jgi:hypothetical protein